MEKNKLNYVVKEDSSKPYKYISKEKFDILKEFHKNFLLINDSCENLNNSLFASQNLMKFINFEDYDKKLSFKTDAPMIKYLTLSTILFSRIFIDNLRHLSRQIKSNEMEVIINEYDEKDEYKMMRALRNYSSHQSIPIYDLSFNGSFSKKESYYDIIINKKELLKSQDINSRDKKYFQNLQEEKINLKTYFEELETLNEKLFVKILEEFSNNINSTDRSTFIECFDKRYEITSEFIEIRPNRPSVHITP
ncbi:hypothetical protein [Lactococcus lactis]|uniref:hypothetical protein n=1 Tax=Lactococcus lactis TaxID=1358 RepID=UPI00223A9071|nr:hypothetical protein [Lactococcus lactis]MCT0026626.1 hypothetical protein [Lactococcus lactis subsp. lactis]MCT3105508.1 hypothetical protein [Lactococcus lactis]